MSRFFLRYIFIPIVLFVAAINVSFGQSVINVPEDYSAIQTALDSANSGDTVRVASGTYEENIYWPETYGLKLIGEDSSNTIIDGGEQGSVIHMYPDSIQIDTNTIIKNFTIQNGGNIDKGGGLYINGGGPKLEKMVIKDNESENAGGIYINNGIASLKDIRILSNSDYGIKSDADTVNLNKVIVSNNNLGGIHCNRGNFEEVEVKGHIGFGISCNGGNFTKLRVVNNGSAGLALEVYKRYENQGDSYIENSVIKDNGGTGIVLGLRKTAIINDVIVNNNNDGGIAYEDKGITGSRLTIKNSTIFGNRATSTGSSVTRGAGGGIFIINGETKIINSVIASNSADGSYGGGICIRGNTTIRKTTIVNNSLNGFGGGLSIARDAEIHNVNVLNNHSSEQGDGIYVRNIFNELDISNLNIIRNGGGVHNGSDKKAQLINNWWGEESGPYHPNENLTGEGDSVNILTDIDPWLTTPDTTAPPIPPLNTEVIDKGSDFITVSWDSSKMADLAGYRIYYDTDTSGIEFANMEDFSKGDSIYRLDGLTVNEEYRIALTTIDEGGNESWYSRRLNVQTRLVSVQNLNFIDEDSLNLINHTPTITFDFYDSGGETQQAYHIQVSTDSSFSTIDMWDTDTVQSGSKEVTYEGEPLQDGEKYFLRIKLFGETVETDWERMPFRMNEKLLAVEPVSPVEGTRVVDLTQTFTWELNENNDGDSLSYELQVSLDRSFTDPYISALTDSNEYEANKQLNDNSIYLWRVITEDNIGEIAISDTIRFFTNKNREPPLTFGQLSPDNGGKVLSKNPELIWEKAKDNDPLDYAEYTVVLSTVEGLQKNRKSIDAGRDTSITLESDLLDNTKYFWSVVAVDTDTLKTRSDTLSFTVDTDQEPPLAFGLISPEDKETEVSQTPTFIWEQTDDPDPNDAVTYTVKIGKDNLFTEEVRSIDAGSDTSVTIQSELDNNSKYYWSVTALGDDSLATYSDTLSFVVGTITDIDNPEELPDEYKLHDPYPNPFNPQTTIKYDLPKPSEVEINVYNITGRKVRTLLDKKQSAGSYQVRFDGSGLPSGTYIFRMMAGEYQSEQSVILLK